MISEQDYRPGLSAEELVRTLRSLLAAERTAMRLTCRYLADLADCMEAADDALPFRDRACGTLIIYADVYHAAQCLFGLGAHSTRERIRVGKALRSLPRIESALLSGEVSYSRAREVTRVATPENESTWLDLARTLPMRNLERRVIEAAAAGKESPAGTSESEPEATGKSLSAGPAQSEPEATGKDLLAGSAPSEPGTTGKAAPERAADPAHMRWTTPETVEVKLRLPAEAWALLQRAMEGARRASETSLSDADALAAVARDAIEQQTTGADTTDPRNTVVLYECQSCHRAEVDTGAGALEIGASAAATLGCGARVRDLRTEGRIVRRGGPLPKAIERAVRLRDRNSCRVPGCYRRRYVDVHHIDPRSEGGAHSRANCVCLCTTHHARLHDGRLRIEGDAEGDLMFFDAKGAPLTMSVVSQSGTGTGSTAFQSGTGTMPVVSQSGTGTGSTAFQSGTGTVPVVSQSATGTGATASQSGTGTVPVVSQSATGIGATAFQSGTGTMPVVSQSGTGTGATASQSGIGAGPALSRCGMNPQGVTSQGGTAAAPHRGRAAAMGVGEEAATLLALIGRRGGWTVDALVDASGLRVNAVQAALLGLELDGRVVSNGFGSYAPCA